MERIQRVFRNDEADLRLDRIGFLAIPENDEDRKKLGLIEIFKKDGNGNLRGKAAVTNVGVFSYRLPDGRIRRELRPPEEVFHPDSIESLRMVPFTDDHPTEKVSPENSKKYQVGSLGDAIDRDELHLYAPIVITDAATIDKVVNLDKRALSCGYEADLEEKAGVWCGVPYDAIQRNIRYNHVALVPVGRAGDAAVIRMDSAGVQLEEDSANTDTTKLLQESDSLLGEENHYKEDHMKSVRIDGVDYQAEAQVITALKLNEDRADAAEQEVAELQVRVDSLQAEKDSNAERADAAEAKAKDLESQLASSIKADQLDSLVASKIALMDTARAANVEVKADMSDMDIKKAVILVASPKADLADKSEAYIQARFDAAVEQLDLVKEDKAAKKQGEEMAGGSKEEDEDMEKDGKGKKDAADSIKSHSRMVNDIQDAWKQN